MTILGIDTVAVVVSDRRRAIAWYRDVLGLDVAYIGPNDPTAKDGEGTPEDPGHWIEMGPLRPRTRIHACELRETEPGPAGITFLTDDIRADHERMTAKGVVFTSPPTQMDWGEWLAEFRDPDGNVFDLKQPTDLTPWDALDSTTKNQGIGRPGRDSNPSTRLDRPRS